MTKKSKPEPKAKPLVELIGDGCLYISGSGQHLNCLKDDEIIRAQRPGPRSGFDTAYVSRYDRTDFVQWYGRRSDGCFHPWGKIMRLTPAGKKAAKAEESAAIDKRYAAIVARDAQTAAAQPEQSNE